MWSYVRIFAILMGEIKNGNSMPTLELFHFHVTNFIENCLRKYGNILNDILLVVKVAFDEKQMLQDVYTFLD